MADVYYNAGSLTGSGSWATITNWFNCPFGCFGRANTGVLPGVTDCVILESNISALGANRTVASICNSNIAGNPYCGGKSINIDCVLTVNGGVPSCMTNGSAIILNRCIVMSVASTSLTVENGTISGPGRIVTGGATLNICGSTTSNGSICNSGGGTVQFFNSTNDGTIICNAPSNSDAQLYITNSINRGTICNLCGTNTAVFSNSINCSNVNTGTSLSPGTVIFGCTFDDCSINYGVGSAGCYIFCGCSVHCGNGGTSTCYFFNDESTNHGCMLCVRTVCFLNNSVNRGCLSPGGASACTWLSDNALNCGFICATKHFLDWNACNLGTLVGSCSIFLDSSVNAGNVCASSFALFCDITVNSCNTTAPTTCFCDGAENTGSVTGNAIFGTTCENIGVINGNATFICNDNRGCVTGCGFFCNSCSDTINYCNISGNACFGSCVGTFCAINCGTVIGTGNFCCKTGNEGCVQGNTSFSGFNTYNCGQVGTGTNTASFASCACNDCGTICGNGVFSCNAMFCSGLITGNGSFGGCRTDLMSPENFCWGATDGCICGNMCFTALVPGSQGELNINGCTPYFYVNVGGCFIDCNDFLYEDICFNGNRLNDQNTWVCGCYVGKFSNYTFKSGDRNFATIQGSCSCPLLNVTFTSCCPCISETVNCGIIIGDASTNVLFTGSCNPNTVNCGVVISNTDFTRGTINRGTICGNACFYSTDLPTSVSNCSWSGRIVPENFSSNICCDACYVACDINDALISNGLLGCIDLTNTKGSIQPFSCLVLCGNDVYAGHNASIPCLFFNGSSRNNTVICESDSYILFTQCSLNCGTVYCAHRCNDSNNIAAYNFLNQGCYLCNLTVGVQPYIPVDEEGCVAREAIICGSNVFGARIDGNLVNQCGCTVEKFVFTGSSINCGKIPVKTFFYNTASNTGTVAVTGIFCNCSQNRGDVRDVVFNNYAFNGCNGTYTNLIAYNSLQKGLNGAPILGGLPPKSIT